MILRFDDIEYEVPREIESEGREAIRAWIVEHLPPAHAALALGEPAPTYNTEA